MNDQTHNPTEAARPRPARPSRGFTLVELLMVMAIVIILLSLILVAMNRATRTAQTTNTVFLMNSISQGIVLFKEDFGYLPPVLGDGSQGGNGRPLRDLFPPFGMDATRDEIQDWRSATSLPEYLVGYGHHLQDGYGIVPGAPANNDWDAESPPLGIRDPGFDGVWNATTVSAAGRLSDRMPNAGTEGAPRPSDKGQRHGPYVSLEDERLLGTVDQTFRVRLPGEGGFNLNEVDGQDNAVQAAVFLDYWGNPITYYRRAYPEGTIKQSLYPHDLDGDGQPDRPPDLSDVIALRPYDVPADGGTNSRILDDNDDPTTSFALRSADFALFSPGADRAARTAYRVDPDGFNEDNVVVTGP
ncbi:MAG: type II secretion system protein [Planctomycetota bacterium]|jgi:prepilin-type N-terminal cleavage/methylation domain-containing protein